MNTTLQRLITSTILLFVQLRVVGQVQQPNKNYISDRVIAKACYTVTYIPDTASVNKRRENMILAISRNSSVFYSALAASSDSIINTLTMNSSHQDIQNVLDNIANSPKAEFSYTVFKNYSKKTIHYTQEIQNKVFEQSEKFSSLIWKLYPTDTSSINGYLCSKAITTYAGRDYVAWYTRQVPVSDGPYKFIGLPGLIVKITDTKQHYSFELTSFLLLNNTNIINPPSFPSFTIPATIQEIYKGQLNELYKIANNQTGYDITVSSAQRNNILQKIKLFNNRLELRN